MAEEITNYQCPNCTAPLRFDPKEGKLVCDYCGTIYEKQDVEEYFAKKEQQVEEKEKTCESTQGAEEKEACESTQEVEEKDTPESTQKEWEEEGVKAYECPSCGAQVICEEQTIATQCPYCGNPTVVPKQVKGVLRPDFIIPFKYEKEDAVKALKNHYQKRFFLPKVFKDENHIEEVKGLYVPFWLYDMEVDGDNTFDATRTSTRRRGDYIYTTTRHFDVHRKKEIVYENIPVDASKKMPDDYMDSIEPFYYEELKPYSNTYLPGFYADRYDLNPKQCRVRAMERMRKSTRDILRDTVHGYSSVHISADRSSLKHEVSKYALLPVWVLTTKWKGQNYLFTMNGQTGKMVGDLPVDWSKFWKLWFGIAGGITVALSASGIGTRIISLFI